MRCPLVIVAAVTTGCGFSVSGSAAPGDAVVVDGATDGAVDAATIDASPDAPPDAFVAGRRKRITIDPARVTGTHADFPVWITLTDPQLAARALADGSDIHFRLPGGTALPYEIQRWDKASGRLDAWVRLQVLDLEPTEFDVVYGDPTLAHAPAAPMVFSSSFAAVWHLESATTIADARGARPGMPVGLVAGDGVAAQLGRGVDFDGGTQAITFANPITGGGAHTISLWVSQRATTDNDALVVLGDGDCGRSRWLHSRYGGSTVAVGFYCNDWANPNVNVIGAGWTLLHWVYAGNQSRLYRNGALVAGPFTHMGGVATQGTGGYIGNAVAGFGANMGLNATVDEVRIATTARDAGWIATEHANQSSPSTFYSIGPEQLP